MIEDRRMPGEAKGVVIACSAPGGEPIYAHEREAMVAVARAIAAVKEFAFQENFSESSDSGGSSYFVPDDSLLAADADQLGIKGPHDLFGGVVPWRFATTKAITHELVDSSAERPKQWSTGFGRTVSAAVLPGYTAFSRHDAIRAAQRLFKLGPVRLKPPLSSRGRDQHTVRTVADVEGFLERYRSSHLEECGLVLETHLGDVNTLSVGSTVIDEIAVTYCGAQRTTIDNAGQPVYGGSDLVVVRGGWEALEGLQLPRSLGLAVKQARTYDAAMSGCPGFFASRRNYDVGQGIDPSGYWRSGVLEAGWRIGGGSTAELAAISTMKQEPDVQLVRASAVKEFGSTEQSPANSDVHFHGEDPEEGPIKRYTVVTHSLRGAIKDGRAFPWP
jgi:hypothetical protein